MEIKVQGLDKLLKKLDQLGGNAEEYEKSAVASGGCN